jgi:hypothetical protein
VAHRVLLWLCSPGATAAQVSAGPAAAQQRRLVLLGEHRFHLQKERRRQRGLIYAGACVCEGLMRVPVLRVMAHHVLSVFCVFGGTLLLCVVVPC